MIEVKDLSVIRSGKKIVSDISFSVPENTWLMIAGPNGAGKSTVLNAMTQSIDYQGMVLFQGTDVKKMNGVRRAQSIGVLTQSHFVGYSFTVEEVVGLGRYAYAPNVFKGKSDGDIEAIEEALRMTGMLEQRQQSVLTLSGGELQRTFLAQVFAQDPKVLLLDEPTNHLDLVYQKQVFTLISQWLEKPGRAVVSVVHDLSLAKAFGREALLLHRGKMVAKGSAEQILSPKYLNTVYEMDVCGWMHQMLQQWSEPTAE